MTVADEAAIIGHVEALERLGVKDSFAEAEPLAHRIAERQEHLDALQSFDMSALSEAARESIEARLRAIASDTAGALEQLKDGFEVARKKQGELVNARGAARGYRPDMSRRSHAVSRKA